MKTRLIDISTLEPFDAVVAILPIRPDVLESIKSQMSDGYDESKPIDVWGNLIIDGHTRVEAAKAVGISHVPAYEHEFENEDAAFDYAIRLQVARRNLSSGEVFKLIEVRDRRQNHGGDRGNQHTGGKASNGALAKSADETASAIGVSAKTVERARAVIDYGDEHTKEAVRRGTKSIYQAYNETSEKLRHTQDSKPRKQSAPIPIFQQKLKEYYTVTDWESLSKIERAKILAQAKELKVAKFNDTNENVEWALKTWNPVTGCLHNCVYCYARDIANRFYPQKFEPVFLPHRLTASLSSEYPSQEKIAQTIGHKNVFVCSMADLFGKWVPQDWIDAVFEQVKHNPNWNFLFLTKFPQRLAELRWPI